MREINGLVEGPFKNEAEFKAAVLKELRKDNSWTRFELENEEKEPGMPDTVSVSRECPAFFIEFKISDSRGVVEFQKTQPLFYKRHLEGVYIDILAWDRKRERVVGIDPEEVVGAKALRIQIPEEIE